MKEFFFNLLLQLMLIMRSYLSAVIFSPVLETPVHSRDRFLKINVLVNYSWKSHKKYPNQTTVLRKTSFKRTFLFLYDNVKIKAMWLEEM